jgi:Ca-activated chloride channel family protein
MRNLARLFLVLALLACAAGSLLAQTRPRRVEPSAPAARTPAPAVTSASTPAPVRPGSQSGQPAPAQSKRGEVAEEVGEDEVVRVNASLVTVPVSVLDRDGRFIGGLHKEDFRIFEDGTEQEVAYFAPVEQPFTVALVIDTSGSTRFKLEDIQDAAIAFLEQLRPDDRVIVVSFDDEVRVLSEATNDRGALRSAIRRTRTGNGTRLYDAVDLVIRQQLSRVQGRKAIVLFTDGVDTSSKHASYRSTLAEAEELDAMIYPVQYDTYDAQSGGGGGGWPGRSPYPTRRKPGLGDVIGIILGGGGVTVGSGGGGAGTSRADYERAGEYLRQLAAETGGRHHNAQDLRYIEEAFTNIAEELRRQYSLGYYPSRQAQAQERRLIKVRVKRPNLVVRARDSYVYRPAGGGPATNTAQDTNTRGAAPELRPHQFTGGGRGSARER